MLLSLQLDPIVGFVSVLALLIMLIGLVLRRFKQPYIIGYILVGALLGEYGLGMIQDAEAIRHLGEIGIILLLFFIGMEISLPELVKQWRLAVLGTLLQVAFSVLIMLGIGYLFGWHMQRSIILGFVIALSSSAVIIKLLEDKNLLDTQLGKNVLSILLTQDIILVPLLIVSSLLGGEPQPMSDILLMVLGGLLIIGVLIYLYKKRKITLPFESRIGQDHELQVFLALFLCFGGALLSSLFGISPALGAFVGGMLIHASNATRWIYDTLHAFQVLFVAFFFVSVGLQLDFVFIYGNLPSILIGLLVVYVTNHFINSLILRLFTVSWPEALLGGAMLAQIGELSFLLSFTAVNLGVISTFGYKYTISLISLTLIISPFYISLAEKLTTKRRSKATLKSV